MKEIKPSEVHVAVGIGVIVTVDAEGAVVVVDAALAAEHPASINKHAITTAADRKKIRTIGEINVRPDELITQSRKNI